MQGIFGEEVTGLGATAASSLSSSEISYALIFLWNNIVIIEVKFWNKMVVFHLLWVGVV